MGTTNNITSVFHQISTIVINIGLWIGIILFLSVPLSFAALFRFSVHFFAKLSRPDLIMATSNDIAVVRETPEKMPISNCGIILRVEGKVCINNFRSHFEEQFLKGNQSLENYINLYCDLVKFCGYLYKRVVANGICLEQHIYEHVLEPGVDVKQFVSSWYQIKFPKGFPLWEIVLIYVQGLNETVIAIKASHVLVDGYSLVHILDKLTATVSPNLVVDNKKSFMQEAKMFLCLPKLASTFLLRNCWSRDTFPSLNYLNKQEMMPMAWGTVDLKPMKLLRQKLNVHFPAIIYSVQVGAIRRLLMEKMNEDELTEYTFLSSSLPVANHPRIKLTNHWTGGKFKIPLKTGDAKQRVLEANQSFLTVMEDDVPYLIWKYVTPLFWLLPARLAFYLSFSNFSLFRYRCSISCIPQSSNQYLLFGQPVRNIYHAPIMKDSFPQAVMLGCSSTHNSQIDFTLFGHSELISNHKAMDRVMQVYFRQELEQLLQQSEITEKLNWRE